jgi:twitching motility protein PilI
MSNREALRDLQSRLAQRMQAVRSEKQGDSWLAVDCAGQGVLFALKAAGEIFSVGNVQPVPRTRDWFMGVSNLRGGLHAVIDLGAFLGIRRPGQVIGEQARLVALNALLGVNCALLVDRLEGLRRAEDLIREDGDQGSRPPFARSRWTDRTGRVWQEIGLAELAAHEQFLTIAE